jgi:hypothetical protein
LFEKDFDFLVVLGMETLHEEFLRTVLSTYFNKECTIKTEGSLKKPGKYKTHDKYVTMEKWLKLIEDTPMMMFSAFRNTDKEKGYFYENNKMVLPSS